MIKKGLFISLVFLFLLFSAYGEEPSDFVVQYENPGSFLAVRELPRLRFTVGARVPMYSRKAGFGFAPQMVVNNREYGLYNYKKELVRDYTIAAVDFGGRVIYRKGKWDAYIGAEFLWQSCWDKSLTFPYEVPTWHYMLTGGVAYTEKESKGFHSDGYWASLAVSYAFQKIGNIRGEFVYEKELWRKLDSANGVWRMVNTAGARFSTVLGKNVTDYFILNYSLGALMTEGTSGSECYRLSLLLSDTLTFIFPELFNGYVEPYFSICIDNGVGLFGECSFDDYPPYAYRFGMIGEFGLRVTGIFSVVFRAIYTYPENKSRNAAVFAIFDVI